MRSETSDEPQEGKEKKKPKKSDDDDDQSEAKANKKESKRTIIRNQPNNANIDKTTKRLRMFAVAKKDTTTSTHLPILDALSSTIFLNKENREIANGNKELPDPPEELLEFSRSVYCETAGSNIDKRDTLNKNCYLIPPHNYKNAREVH